MSNKINLLEIARAQLATFSGYDRKVVARDILAFLGLPIILGVLVAVWGPPVYSVGSLLTGVSVFSGLLVALLVNVFNFSVKIRRDEKIRPEQQLARTVDELMTNAAWTVLIGLLLVVLLASAAATQKPQSSLEPIWVGILVGLVVHLIMNVLMVLSRIWTAHEDIKDLPPKR
jgi:hypothetical protein